MRLLGTDRLVISLVITLILFLKAIDQREKIYDEGPRVQNTSAVSPKVPSKVRWAENIEENSHI